MSASNDSAACAKNCRIMAIIGAVLLWLILWLGADWSFLGALVLAAILGVLAYFLLRMILCSGASEAASSTGTGGSAAESAGTASARAATAGSASSSAGAGAAEPAANSVEKPSGGAADASATTPSTLMSDPADAGAAAPAAKAEAAAGGPKVQPSKALAGQEELAGRKGEWKYEAAPSAAPAAKKKAPAKKAAAKKDAAAKPKRAAVAADGKPELFDAPPADGADDLKLISGVGPKLEQTLNEMGIYRFAQVAGWRKKEVAWVDSRLKFKGRIERDDWISQAKILAKGGETEFSKRKKK